MNAITLIAVVLLCLSIVNGRSFDDRREPEKLSEIENDGIKTHNTQMRHRKRRWQGNYGYDYPAPIPPYYPERRDYDRNQQDLLPKIVRLLEEISAYVRHPQPPPPPQPIYIPYPVPYPVPQYIACTSSTSSTSSKNPNVTIRFPDMEDTNQNWGIVVDEENNEDIGDGSRPISFDPIKPKRPMKRITPKVEHGSVQSDSQQVTPAPKFEDSAQGQIPNMCNAAIISCCSNKNQMQCFSNFGCGDTYYNGKACSSDSINEALEAFKVAYSPM